MEGSEIRDQIKRLVLETMQEMQITNGIFPVLAGIVIEANGDQTVTVGAAGVLFENVSSPRQLVRGQQVLILSVSGVTVAL